MMHAHVADHDLVVAALGGDERAWDALVDRYAQSLWNAIRLRGLDADSAAAIHHATWLDLADRLDDLVEPARVGEWLTAMVSYKSDQALLVQGNDRRREVRLPAVFPITLSFLDDDWLFEGESVDLSAGGLRGRAGDGVPVGPVVVAISACDRVIATAAQVVAASPTPGGDVDLHVAFSRLNGPRRDSLGRLLLALRA
ncbi:MAG TPA: PilZ domain-containing protein [Acidimicrobiales bacterium]|nr:PilZ domain-containing protein [Acidimicrobiales bacterium]